MKQQVTEELATLVGEWLDDILVMSYQNTQVESVLVVYNVLLQVMLDV